MDESKVAAGRRLARFLGMAEGSSVECDLGPYAAVVESSRGIDLSSERDLSVAANALRERIKGAESRGEAGECLAPEGELPLATALFAEAARRALGLEPFRSQLLAGVAMCRGKLAQLPTGEGKTLAAVLPAFLGALAGRGVHVMTANDYLAERDAAWMGPVYALLGLRADRVLGSSGLGERRRAYAADLTYLTAKEAGFDFLRDQLAYDRSEIAQRGFELAIVDEADSILIDEARSPLVIAAREDCGGPGPAEADRVARALAEGRDYLADRAARRVALTLAGEARAAVLLGVGGMHEEASLAAFARLHAALHARALLARDVDYVVREGRALLVDEHTGRVAEGRRWPYGVQAAVEAAEGLEPLPEGRIFGSIAIQHLLVLYPRMAAMTATAEPSAAELKAAYGLDVVVVPPASPSRRVDAPDRLYRTREGKTRALVEEVLRESASGRPVLVGAASVRESEELAAAIRARGRDCALLNAKDDRLEAGIVAEAGRRGALTISTNMAGRGTDIRLGGPGADAREREALAALGGLYVIGANRHETRRIDDQLRGRAGRQGEPGLTRFFVSLEDPLFGRHGVRAFLPRGYREPGPSDEALDAAGPIEDPRALREIDRAQRVLAGRHAAVRESLRRFGLPLEIERRAAREARDRALLEDALPDSIESLLEGADPAARRAAVAAYLAGLDRFWADHLLFAEDIRQGIGLSRFAQRDPGIEYVRRLSRAFDEGMAEAEAAAARDIDAAAAEDRVGGAAGAAPSWRPTGTWTYLVEEEDLSAFPFLPPAAAGLGALAGALAAPLAFAAGAAGAFGRLVGLLRGGRPERPRDAPPGAGGAGGGGPTD